MRVAVVGAGPKGLYAVEELHERIAALEAEIARAKTAIEGKSSKRSAADALFNFR